MKSIHQPKQLATIKKSPFQINGIYQNHNSSLKQFISNKYNQVIIFNYHLISHLTSMSKIQNISQIDSIEIKPPHQNKNKQNTTHQQTNNIQDTIQITANLVDKYLPAIGVIRSHWKNENGQVLSYSHGTAFAISSKLIITCAHNIFSQKRQAYCFQSFFIPNIHKDITAQTRIYRTTMLEQYFKNQKQDESFSIKPLPSQLAVLVLQQKLECFDYLVIGDKQDCKQNVIIVGYPNLEEHPNRYFNDGYFQRQIETGKIHSIQQHVINHTITQTRVGFSGSPILAMTKTGELKAIGIHTHKGLKQQYNSGVYFNEQILNKAKQYQQNLTKYHKLSKNILISINGLKGGYEQKYISKFSQTLQYDYDDIELEKIQQINSSFIEEMYEYQ